VLGAVFWLVVLFQVLRGMRELISHPLPLRAFSLYCGFFLLWDLAFSPFQGERRFMTPVYLLLMILAIRRAREQQSPRRGNRQSYPQGSVKPKGHAELAAVGKC
jgi:hypothetical protein